MTAIVIDDCGMGNSGATLMCATHWKYKIRTISEEIGSAD